MSNFKILHELDRRDWFDSFNMQQLVTTLDQSLVFNIICLQSSEHNNCYWFFIYVSLAIVYILVTKKKTIFLPPKEQNHPFYIFVKIRYLEQIGKYNTLIFVWLEYQQNHCIIIPKNMNLSSDYDSIIWINYQSK